MKKEDSYLNRQNLIDHSSNPRNLGVLQKCDFLSGEYNPSCGDSVVICGQVEEGVITNVRFEGKGCVLSIAMASKLTERVKGMLLDDVLQFEQNIVKELLGLELGLNRLQCGMLSVLALQKGIKIYKDQKNADQ